MKKRLRHKHLHNPPKPHKRILFKYKIKFLVKRAQTGMEYILTYGWAVLIILFALSSLFYIGVFEPNTSSKCIINIPFICNDIKAYDDTIVYTISSKNVKSATVTDILINGQSCSSISLYGNNGILINPGSGPNQNNFDINSQNQIVCIDVPDMYKKTSSEITLNYQTDQGLEHSTTGDSSVNIENGEYIIDYVNLNLNNLDMISGLNFENGFNIVGRYTGNPGVYGNIMLQPFPIIQQVAYFDGSDDYIKISRQPILNSDLITIEFLAKFEQTPAVEYPIFVKEDEIRFNYGFYFNNLNRVDLKINTGGYITSVSSDNLELNEWYHIVGTFDGNQAYLYINGENVRQTISYSPQVFQSPVDIFIGSNALQSTFFKGHLDSVVLYKDYLTDKEVKKHYEHFTPPSS